MEHIVDSLPMPEDWFGPDKHYILRMNGDSMVGAGIEERDYVVIQKQFTACDQDIVAVQIGDSITIKRFVQVGTSIRLIPENEKYKPIELNEDQVNILGVAVGLLKNI